MSHIPDYALMLSAWLQNQFGEDACITHEDTASPIGMNDAAETFTVTVPACQLDRLYLIRQKKGIAGEPFTTRKGRASLRVRLVDPLDILTCRGGYARRQFTVHAQVEQW